MVFVQVSRQSFLKFIRRLVYRRAEFVISLPAHASASGQYSLPDFRHLLPIPRAEIGDGGSRWDFENKVRAPWPVKKLPAPVPAIFGIHFLLAGIRHKRVYVGNALKINIPAASAVPSCRPLRGLHFVERAGA